MINTRHLFYTQNIDKQLIKTLLENFTTLLTAFASHDIKNAIHNMDGVVSQLSVDTITEDEILLIRECANRLRDSLDEFTNIGLPQDTNVIEPFEIVRLMSSISILHRHDLKYENIHYKVVYLLDKSTVISQNFHWLVQSLNNIVINSKIALRNTQDKKIQITLSCDDNSVTILISDNGIGIPPENKPKVFTAYFTTTGGSGIGLAHVANVMKQINGKVELTEEAGFTTTVKLNFPLKCDTPS
ncbi:sensor histidine kinase [Hymenobacter sp. PAMC 26628]|uniref:sensor histidine kinase n=1 Tax=Hymenobacter sp. PAMC 26628 TaxID=1484118 RepID=UPI00090204DF|nr:HAMP domain-containing sensor histidine kinase [Hymenobacter sp. PAMC 26628]